MTKDEVKQKLVRELEEEMNSAVLYHSMALTMKEESEIDCTYLMAIAKDEMSHALYIHDYLHEKGIAIPEQLEQRYITLKSAHKF